MKELKFLEEQGVSSSLINKIVKFREVYPVSDEVKNRIIKPAIPFYGKDILEMAIAGILQGQNLLLTGPKPPVKIFWQKIWHIYLTGLLIIFLFTSIQTVGI